MRKKQQVLRFAVGIADGPRSRTWRLWVPKQKSDVYISSRILGSAFKVSLHEPGPSRFALTSEWVRRTGFEAPADRDSRLAVEWNRPRPQPPRKTARPLSIFVPYDEVQDRASDETGKVVWIPPPPEGTLVEFNIVYTPAGAEITGHPGERSMGTKLVGVVKLHNGEYVFVVWRVLPMTEAIRRQASKLRSANIIDKDGKPSKNRGMLTFGIEPNPDADDGTEIGKLLDVTRQLSN